VEDLAPIVAGFSVIRSKTPQNAQVRARAEAINRAAEFSSIETYVNVFEPTVEA
jgi:hypothetical protein